jgi:hypothetical protein
MRDKWKAISNNKNKGYWKIHVAVNAKSKKILSMKVVTDEHVHDSKVLPRLVEDVIKSGSIEAVAVIGKLFADSASMIAMMFLDVCQTIECCHALK